MGRRRKQTLASDLIALPWQVGATLAVASFAGIRWVAPGFLGQSPVLVGMRAMAGPLSWLALCFFGVLALLAALRIFTARKKAPSQAGAVVARGKTAPAPERTSASSVTARLPSAPQAWSLEALRTLEWKRFELLCARYYQALGFQAETLQAGPDGGIDVKLYKADPSRPLAIVQCKAWNTRQVGVKEIRELLGVMVHAKVARGIFITTGVYSEDALAFGAANPIQLLDGAAFERRIGALPEAQRQDLLAFAFDGDYLTPSCPSCGVKMLARNGKRGSFWGCRHYPRCKSALQLRA